MPMLHTFKKSKTVYVKWIEALSINNVNENLLSLFISFNTFYKLFRKLRKVSEVLLSLVVCNNNIPFTVVAIIKLIFLLVI